MQLTLATMMRPSATGRVRRRVTHAIDLVVDDRVLFDERVGVGMYASGW
jgi:hypothetical protein